MKRIFLSLFTIFLINQRVSSISNIIIESNDIEKFQDYIQFEYGKKLENLRSEPSIIFDAVLLFVESTDDLSFTWTEWLRAIERFDVNKSDIAKILKNNIGNDEDFQDVRVALYENIIDIEYYHEEGLKFYDYVSYSNKTLMNFINSVLNYRHNLPQSLFHIYELIMRTTSENANHSFISFVLQYVNNNHEHFCDTFVSPQMQAYYIFMQIIQIELKGFETITQAYLLQFLLDHGVNVLQLDSLFQVIVRSECDIRSKLGLFSLNCAWGSCEDLKSTSRDEFVVDNCKTYKSIKGCPVENSHGRLRFSWWKTDSETVGHAYNCPNNLYELSFKWAGWYYNDVCLCSVNFTGNSLRHSSFDSLAMNFTMPKIIKISTEPQLADIANNMIVVGVKFILHNNSIHLQIKQAKVSRGGSFATESSWKPVDIDNNNNTISTSYGVVYDRQNILYLDDVHVDRDHVVTGVKFQEAESGKGFELHVQSTKFNYNTGKLDGSQKWHKPGANPVNSMDYQRNRMEIVLNDPDDPTLAPYNRPDLKANKFIQFQHSSIHKDAGYHVVPFFDAQSVETSPEFPLSGIGLFHRGLDGFGGYIAPRLFTQDLTWAIESLFHGWEQLSKRPNINLLVGDYDVTKCGKYQVPNKDSHHNQNEVN